MTDPGNKASAPGGSGLDRLVAALAAFPVDWADPDAVAAARQQWLDDPSLQETLSLWEFLGWSRERFERGPEPVVDEFLPDAARWSPP